MATADIERQLADLRRRIPADLPEEDRRKFIEAQSRAERAAQAFGDSAPHWVSGENLLQYRRRLLGPFKQHSSTWRGVELSRLDADALNVAEPKIYADAWDAVNNPATVPEGTLREIVETDRTGRRISRFVGSPEACWGQFKAPAKLVVGWRTKG